MTKSKGPVLLLSGLLTSSALLAPFSPAVAAYEMEAYTNWPGGKEIVAGDYGAAIDKAASSAHASSWVGLVATTNLCVAHTVRRELTAASAACERAVELAKREDAAVGSRFARTSATAKALTNRGVLRAVRGDADGAAGDFRKAVALRGTEAPARNLAYLESLPPSRLAAAD